MFISRILFFIAFSCFAGVDETKSEVTAEVESPEPNASSYLTYRGCYLKDGASSTTLLCCTFASGPDAADETEQMYLTKVGCCCRGTMGTGCSLQICQVNCFKCSGENTYCGPWGSICHMNEREEYGCCCDCGQSLHNEGSVFYRLADFFLGNNEIPSGCFGSCFYCSENRCNFFCCPCGNTLPYAQGDPLVGDK